MNKEIENYKNKIESLNMNIEIWYKVSMILILGFLAINYHMDQIFEKKMNKMYVEYDRFYQQEYTLLLSSLRNGIIKNDQEMIQAAARKYNEVRKKDIDTKEKMNSTLANYNPFKKSFTYLLLISIPLIIILINKERINKYNKKIDNLYMGLLKEKES